MSKWKVIILLTDNRVYEKILDVDGRTINSVAGVAGIVDGFYVQTSYNDDGRLVVTYDAVRHVEMISLED